jgi:hypothetical protein
MRWPDPTPFDKTRAPPGNLAIEIGTAVLGKMEEDGGASDLLADPISGINNHNGNETFITAGFS